MSLLEIHAGVARAATTFMIILAIWALLLRFRSRPLDGNWFGAAMVGELLLVAQFLIGWLLYFQTGGAGLPRAYLHILYGVVTLLVLPVGYSYFSRIDDDNVKTVAMAFICFFLWGVILRTSTVADLLPVL